MRSCTVRDEHLGTCTNDQCTGCWPRPASHGYLCNSCYSAHEDAQSTADRLERDLPGIDRAVQKDADGSHVFGPSIPIAPVPLALDEIRSWRRAVDLYTEAGATAAIYFIRSVRSAARAHPTAETEHAIPKTRCPKCQKRSLKWKPPAHFLDLVLVTCRDEDTCGFIADQTSFETLAMIEKPLKPAKAALEPAA